ncbi:MAG: sporulation protein [Desulfobacterales bacterium]|nr:sporulation protein [Desulfobacterales bacterium]
MSFMKRMLSSVGIGSAKVDTILAENRFAPGDVIDAEVKITGGKVEQEIDDIYFSICATYEAEVDDDKVTRVAVLDKFKASDSFVISPGDVVELNVSLQLPFDAPLSIGKTKVWVETGLDIDNAVDPGDKDHIEVVAGQLVGAIFESLQSLGFKLAEAECEAVSAPRGALPFVQEFEFKPYGGPFRDKLDELELICFPSEDNVEVFMEIDRKARGVSGFFAEMLNTDESHVRLVFNADDLPDLTDKLHEIIAERS